MTTIAKFWSVGDWEALYIDGEAVKQNHQRRVDVLSHIDEGSTIDAVVSRRLNLPEDDFRYPSTLEEMDKDDRYDFDLSELGEHA